MKVLWVWVVFVATTANAINFDPQCPPEQEVDWEIELLLPHPDCDKFYKCTYGQPVEKLCPAGLFFNLVYMQCDWQHNVDCTDRNIPGQTTTPRPTTPAPTTPAPTTPAPTTPAPTTPAPTTPRPTTPQPTTPRPTTPRPTTPQTTTTPRPTPSPDFLENGCPVNPHVHWLLPHEVDCNLFYYCVWGRKVQRRCPSSLHFNRRIQVCDWPINAGCPTSYQKHIQRRGFFKREF